MTEKDSHFLSEVSHSLHSAWRPLQPILNHSTYEEGGKRDTQSRNKKTPWGDCVLCTLNFTPTCHWTCCSLIRPIHTQGINTRPFVICFQVRLHWCWEQNVVSLIHLRSNFQVTSGSEFRTTHERNYGKKCHKWANMCKWSQWVKKLLILQKTCSTRLLP